MILSKYRKEILIEICQELIRAEGTSGKEEKSIKIAENYMKKLGFDEIAIDNYGSLIGKLKGNKPGKKILLDTHIDTVEADINKWSKNPFEAKIENDRIYGRGSSDMKGAIAAILVAASSFAKENEFSGEIYVSCDVHEELFEGVAARKISEKVKPDYVIIGEASDLKIMRGQRGRAEIVIETKGVSSHTSNPEIGHNAVYDMVEVIKKIKEVKCSRHDILGKGIMELTDIISSPYPGASVIPDNCKVTYDRRLLVDEDKNKIVNDLKNILKKLNIKGKVYYENNTASCWTGEEIQAEKYFLAWILDKDHDLILKSIKGVKRANIKPVLSHYSFCTNGSHFAGEANIPTIGFGPSKESLAHIVDEYIEIEQLFKAFKGYYFLIKEILE